MALDSLYALVHLKVTGVFEELKRVSGTGEPNKGIGLYAVAEDARQLRGSLLLHSGLGSLEIREDRESSARRTRLFPGTLAYLAVPA